MDDKTLQRKLSQLVKIANELDDEAKRRYGPKGNLFFESEGDFHIMTGDSTGTASERQKYIKFSSHGSCRLGAGAW
jgi:hypothetical protein